MMTWIKKRWHEVSDALAGTTHYFKKSPSSMLQKTHVSEAISTYGHGTVLDAGAGRSVYASFFPSGTVYHAMDFAETEGAYKKNAALHLVGDIQQIPAADNTYDTVLCSEVLEHVPHPEKASAEILRVLKPGGHAIVTTPFLGYYHDEPYDFFRYTKHGLRTLFEDAHGEIISIKGVGGIFCFYGYIRSTILLSLVYGVPGFWHVVFWLNVGLNHIDIVLDRITKNGTIMPLTNVTIVRKRSA